MTSLSSPSTDSSLIVRVQRDDPAAWRTFVDLYGPLIYSWCRRKNLAAVDAAEVVQETLLAISRAIPTYDATLGRLRGWLWTVTKNKLLDFFRRGPAVAAAGGSEMALLLQEVAEQPPPDAEGETSELRPLLDRALRQVELEIEPQTYQAFVLVVLRGASTAEAAAQLGLSANSIRQAKSRVLRRLRQLIEGWNG